MKRNDCRETRECRWRKRVEKRTDKEGMILKRKKWRRDDTKCMQKIDRRKIRESREPHLPNNWHSNIRICVCAQRSSFGSLLLLFRLRRFSIIGVVVVVTNIVHFTRWPFFIRSCISRASPQIFKTKNPHACKSSALILPVFFFLDFLSNAVSANSVSFAFLFACFGSFLVRCCCFWLFLSIFLFRNSFSSFFSSFGCRFCR